MISAKDKFREGYIMVNRPFKFFEMDIPIQKFTIFWAYSEQPVFEQVLTEEAKEEAYHIANPGPFGRALFSNKDAEAYIDEKLSFLFDSAIAYKKLYLGDIVQVFIGTTVIRLYPEEYTILTEEKIKNIIAEDGYHAVVLPGATSIQQFKDSMIYLRSRGVSKSTATKWSSIGLKGMVYYKPYFSLLESFSRPHEIMMPDQFYKDVEGINPTKITQKHT